ncbi:MAG: POTRA domain-containing protein, partial [Chitinophagaceae bacterium]
MSIITSLVQSQDIDPFHKLPVSIRNIKITGNRQTKSYIILRELPMKKGMAYPMSFILSGMYKGKNNLMNTTLFVSASIDFTNWFNDSLDLVVDVKERWYWIPLPFLRPIDTNL